jgi:hypothetical protein
LLTPKGIVLEAALMFCHGYGAEHLFVRVAAEKVNDLLIGLHGKLALEDRKGGSWLPELPLQGRRVTKGYKIELTDSVRQQIHALANSSPAQGWKQVLPPLSAAEAERTCSGGRFRYTHLRTL